MKILLIGCGGQVGCELARTLLPLGEVVAWSRVQADLAQEQVLAQSLRVCAPDIIVNAAAYTAVDRAETEVELAFQVNAKAVAVMAAYANEHHALLVHYSSDYVFDGRKSESYVETDPTHPLSVYGRSKLAGEVAILHSGCRALIFRTSWVFSANGANFVKTVLRLAHTRSSVNMVADQYGAPTSAELIADVSALALAAYRQDRLRTGVYHLTASGYTTWCELARHVVARAKLNGASLTLTHDQIRPIPALDYPVPALRPVNSRLNTDALSKALGLELPDWAVHINRTVDQLSLQERGT
jgi:dTDP-4-dehydrorhamnose reductase